LIVAGEEPKGAAEEPTTGDPRKQSFHKLNSITYIHYRNNTMDCSDIFTAQQLLGKRRRRGRLEYLVQWQGFSNEHNTWEPKDNILDPVLVEEFNYRIRKHLKKEKRHSKTKRLNQAQHRDSTETLHHTTLWRHGSVDSVSRHSSSSDTATESVVEMASYLTHSLPVNLRYNIASSCSSDSSSSSSSCCQSPSRLAPPLTPHSLYESECSTMYGQTCDALTSPRTLHSPSALSESSYSQPPTPTSSLATEHLLPVLMDVVRFVQTPYWRYSPHKMPPKKRWLVSEILSDNWQQPTADTSEVKVIPCHHTFPICHMTDDKLR
jgi:hypothetical protein